jgi:hypothetical protein
MGLPQRGRRVIRDFLHHLLILISGQPDNWETPQ